MRVLVVDDSAFMRKIISEMIDQEDGFEVVATARDGEDGVKKAVELKPDIITLDIEMPKKDGLTALREIKARCHSFKPAVLMCSSLTVAGSQETLKALRIGASDFIAKDPAVVGKHDAGFNAELINKLKALRGHRVDFTHSPASSTSSKKASDATSDPEKVIDLSRVRAVVVGSSTGGPPALEEVFSRLPASLKVPIVVAQHMPEVFTKSLAVRLDQQCACSSQLAMQGTIISDPGVYIAQGGAHIEPRRIAGSKIVAKIIETLPGAIYRPSVDHLFSTASEIYGDSLLAIELTGMGADGAIGAGDVKRRGGQVIAQSGETCVVFGMPKAVIDAGHADAICAPENIRDLLSKLGHQNSTPTLGRNMPPNNLRESA